MLRGSLRVSLFLALLFPAWPGFGASLVVLVSTTEIESPAIQGIIRGVSSAAPYAQILETEDPAESIAKIDAETKPSIIILGKSLLSAASAIKTDNSIIGGGFYGNLVTVLPFDTYPLDPSFDTIHDAVVGVGFPLQRLLTVSTNETVKRRVMAIASASEDVEVIIKEAHGPKSTARAWFELLRTLEPSSDAVWIVDDSFLDETDSYRHITKTAWKQRILVLTGLPRFANRGVSIGFVPDLQAYGEYLVEMVQRQDTREKLPSVGVQHNATTSVLRRVYNQRTLGHVGYHLPDDVDTLELEDIILR